MKLLLKNKVEISLFTNSLTSTDSLYVAAHLYNSIFKWAKMGMKTYIHSGKFMSETQALNDEVENSKWGTHSKSHIYESITESGNVESEIMIGTYNIDNRSNFYNNEMAIFCKGNSALTEEAERQYSIQNK